MFQTITDITLGPSIIQQPIDNRVGCLQIGLRSITYTVGWYNIKTTEFAFTDTRVQVRPGLWTFEQLREYLGISISGLILQLNETTGFVELGVQPKIKSGIRMTGGLLDLLGFDRTHSLFQSGRSIRANRPINFAPHRLLFIHLKQLNTSDNALNGVPSTLLAVVAVGGWSYGEIKSCAFPNPEFKRLTGGTLSELELSVRDENGKIIDNHGLPISVVLEIK
jgi:hypothetical protein